METIEFLTGQLYKEGKISSREEFYQAVMEREAMSETGIDKGMAIPHGKSGTVKEAAFAVAVMKKPVEDWKSIVQGNEVRIVFLLAIPEAEAGSTHLELLAELMTRVTDDGFLNRLKTAKTREEFCESLEAPERKREGGGRIYSKTIAAVTACPAGIAHTYMAAQALVDVGEEMGVRVYVEKQGANGVEDRHTGEQLKEADAAVFAADVAVKDSGRYEHLPVYETRACLKIASYETRACLKIASRQLCVTLCGRFVPDEGGVVGYAD